MQYVNATLIYLHGHHSSLTQVCKSQMNGFKLQSTFYPRTLHLRYTLSCIKNVRSNNQRWRRTTMTISMAELPSVITSALIHVINTLENDDTHQYHWKISRNSENVSFLRSAFFPPKVSHVMRSSPDHFL